MEIYRDGYRDKKRKYRQTIAPFAVPYEGVKIHLMISFRYGITRISRKKNKENLCFPCNLCFREFCVIPCLKEIIKYVLIYSFVFPVFGINSVNRLLISFQINTFKLSFNLLIRFMLWTNCFSGWYRPLPFWRFALPGISIVR